MKLARPRTLWGVAKSLAWRLATACVLGLAPFELDFNEGGS